MDSLLFYHFVLVLVFCCFGKPSWSDCYIQIYCNPFQMAATCKAHMFYHMICFFVWSYSCTYGGYLCHHNSVLPSLSYQIPLFLYLCPTSSSVPSVLLPCLLNSIPDHWLFHLFLIISVIISLLLIPFLNSSFSLLSFSLYSH